jgi:hypothetical protein
VLPAFLEGLLVKIEKRDVCTLPGKTEGDGPADASGSAGDDGGSGLQFHGIP